MPTSFSLMSTAGASADSGTRGACSVVLVTSVRSFIANLLSNSSGSVDRDLARLGRFALGDGDPHDAVTAGRMDLVRIGVLGQADHAAELAREAFLRINADVILALLVFGVLGAFSADHE